LIVYSATKSEFQDDVMTNDIGGIIFDAFRTTTGKHTSESEIRSWMSSLQYMDRVLNDDEIPFDAGVAIEYHLPQTSKRIDFILTGRDKDRRESAVLVELKQWQKAELTQSDAVVITRFKHGPAEALHPSYEAWSYKRLLEDFNPDCAGRASRAVSLRLPAQLRRRRGDHPSVLQRAPQTGTGLLQARCPEAAAIHQDLRQAR
jgi:hypothetical protein